MVVLLLALVVAILALLVAGALALQVPAGRMPVVHTLVAVTLAGGLGGFINAALCFLGWPVEVKGADFQWHVMPAGFAHGAILALVAFTAALVGMRWRRQLRWALAIGVGGVAGALGWIPLLASVGPWASYENFGLVSALWYLWLACEQRSRSTWANVLAACVAGMAGALLFWTAWPTMSGGPEGGPYVALTRHPLPWPLGPLHGCIWGCLVGSAISRFRPPTAAILGARS